jgi:hypothetical protein
MYEQYEGHVDIQMTPHDLGEPDKIKQAAVRKLQRTAFPERNASMWYVDRWEPV